MSMSPDNHDRERVPLELASLRDILLSEGLVQDLLSIGVERTSDLWVLALGERVSPRPEFSNLLRRVLRDLEEPQNNEKDAQYMATISLLSEDRIESEESADATISKQLDGTVVRVSLLMRVSRKNTIYWEAQLQNSRMSQDILEGLLDNTQCRDFCMHLLDSARGEVVRVVNWTEPPTPRWEDLLLKPSKDLFLKWLNSTRNNERDLYVFQQRLVLLSGQRKTLEEVGQELEITRERVRQIVHRFLSHLRHISR